MNKAELVAAVAGRAGEDQATTERVIGALFDTVTDVMKGGDKVAWPGFGAFSASSRQARQGRNPATGAASALKSALNA